MLEYNEITERRYIILDDEPWEVLSSHVFRKQQRKPVNATKLKNMLTGRVTEHSFHVSDKAKEADISTRKIKYLYTNKGEYWFCEEKDPSKRFKLEEEMLGPQVRFLKPNSIVDAMIFTDEDEEDDPSTGSGQAAGKIIGVKVPITVDLKVTEAFDAVKGDTATGGSKTVTLETGATMNVPLFVKEGDIIRINTENAEYRERVS